MQKNSMDMAGARSLIGIEKKSADEESLSLQLQIEEKHLNMNGVTHGGILYALADECVGNYVEHVVGRKGAAMDGSMHYYRPTKVGDLLTAGITVRKQGKRTGIYMVEIKDEQERLVADSLFTVMFMD